MGEGRLGSRAFVPASMALIGCVATSIVLWWPAMHAPFTGDDLETLLAVVADRPRWGWLAESGPRGHARSATWASLWANHRVGGLDPFGYHLTGAVLHGVASWLVWVVAGGVLRLLGGGGRVVAAVAAVVFLVAPMHVEAVVWTAARADLLVATATLGALACALRAGVGWNWWRAASVVLVALAVLAKESGVIALVLVGAFEAWRPDVVGGARSLRAAAARTVPAAFGVLTLLAIRTANGNRTVLDEVDLVGSDGPALVLRRAVQSWIRAFLPGIPAGAWAWVAAGTMLGVAVAGIGVRRRTTPSTGPDRPLQRVALAAGVASVVSVLPGARFGVSPTTMGGERLVYLASAFAAIVLAALLGVVGSERKRWAIGLSCLLVGASVAGTWTATASHLRAARVADRFVASGASLPIDRATVILAVPDSLDGVVTGRYALVPAAVLHHGWAPSPPIVEFAGYVGADPDAAVEVVEGPCRSCVTVVLPAGATWSDQFGSAEGGESWGATEVARDGRRLVVRLDAEALDGADATVWVVTRGELAAVTVPSG